MSRQRLLSDDQVTRLINLYVVGRMNVREVAEKFHVGYGTAHKVLKEANVLRPKGYRTPSQKVKDDASVPRQAV